MKQLLHKSTYGSLFIYNSKPEFKFLEVNQVHGKEICSVRESSQQESLIIADGLITTFEEFESTPIAIKTADCLPIFIIGQKGLALIHAGWRGLYQKILTEDKVKQIAPLEAFIGPAICSNCYEVSDDFKSYFSNSQSLKRINGQLHFDLISEAKEQLKETYPNINILKSIDCTSCHEKLHSFRQNKTNKRNYTVFIPN